MEIARLLDKNSIIEVERRFLAIDRILGAKKGKPRNLNEEFEARNSLKIALSTTRSALNETFSDGLGRLQAHDTRLRATPPQVPKTRQRPWSERRSHATSGTAIPRRPARP